MSQLLRHPAYLVIEDRLDAIGQRFRVLRIVRGAMLFVGGAVLATALAALVAHVLGTVTAGTSKWLVLVPIVWGVWLAGSFFVWFVRPMVLRPKPLEVARLVETRVGGLHNGLTNGLLLAHADDLQASPWLPAIFDEIAAGAGGKPLERAVKFSDLRPVALRAGAVVLPLLVLCLFPFFQNALGHGLRQMFSPGVFVPKVGSSIEGLKVTPGDVTLVAGQPMEIDVTAVSADADFMPNGRLIFDGGEKPALAAREAELVPTAGVETPEVARGVGGSGAGGGPPAAARPVLRYSYRVEHVDATMRYRVEVAGTQSPWFTATAVPQVRLKYLEVTILPPPYMRKELTKQTVKAEDLDKTPITVPQGGRLTLAATVDVPVKGAMLQLGESPPTPMEAGSGGRRFEGSATILDDTPVAVLLTMGNGQIISKLPEKGLVIHCSKDAPPTIEMKWPTADAAVAPDAEIKIEALLKDDVGLGNAVVLMSAAADQPLAPAFTQTYPPGETAATLSRVLAVPAELRKNNQSIRVQVTATDTRDLRGILPDARDAGPQTVASAVYEIKFRDPAAISAEEKEIADKLREELTKMLRQQKALHAAAVAVKPADLAAGAATVAAVMKTVNAGQAELRAGFQRVGETFKFDEKTKVIQKTLLVMAAGVAREAVDFSLAVQGEPVAKERARTGAELQARQRQIISTLESLLAFLNLSAEPTTQPSRTANEPLPNRAEKFEKLNETLKEFMKEEQRILDQTAGLAKKPVDNFDDKDKKLLEDLKQAQDKMDAFMKQTLSDFSKNAEQDMANAALIKDMLAVYSEVTMAKDALKQQSVEIAVAAEEMGLENAKELSSNLEKWLPNAPDRQKWTQEDPLGKNDTPMPELPKEMEDMVGKLMEQQEDLDEEAEDANANWTDSMDKGVGWDAADGPIADMSAKGVTGNTLPNDNEMAGRSGEGRSGKSQGEFVGDNAQGKGGRNTPTRLDPTPFAQGQIKDESKDPVGGATGGGKMSGQGGQGLEGPVPPKMKQEMQRLADKQAQIRNAAERLQLQYHLGRYDNFNLAESIALMRRNESDWRANRYQNAMRRADVIVDDLAASKTLLGGQIHVQRDTTPTATPKVNQDVNDAMKGDLPAAWSDALKEYYKKLAAP